MTICTIWLVLLLALAGCKSTSGSRHPQQYASAETILVFLRDNGLPPGLKAVCSRSRNDLAGLYSKSGGMGHGWDWYLFEDGTYYEVMRACTAGPVHQGRWAVDGATLQLTQSYPRPKAGRGIRRSMMVLREGRESLPVETLRLLDITVAYRSIIYVEQNRLLVEQGEEPLPHSVEKPLFLIYPRERDLNANDKIALGRKLKAHQEWTRKVDEESSE